MPTPRPPTTAISASAASPGPFTAQPITATRTGFCTCFKASETWSPRVGRSTCARPHEGHAVSKGPLLTACPSCGRAQVDLPALGLQVSEALKQVQKPVRVAVMGCAVNGPGEAADADIAVVGGRGVGMIYIKGKPSRRVPEDQVIATLMEEIAEWEPS